MQSSGSTLVSFLKRVPSECLQKAGAVSIGILDSALDRMLLRLQSLRLFTHLVPFQVPRVPFPVVLEGQRGQSIPIRQIFGQFGVAFCLIERLERTQPHLLRMHLPVLVHDLFQLLSHFLIFFLENTELLLDWRLTSGCGGCTENSI